MVSASSVDNQSRERRRSQPYTFDEYKSCALEGGSLLFWVLRPLGALLVHQILESPRLSDQDSPTSAKARWVREESHSDAKMCRGATCVVSRLSKVPRSRRFSTPPPPAIAALLRRRRRQLSPRFGGCSTCRSSTMGHLVDVYGRGTSPRPTGSIAHPRRRHFRTWSTQVSAGARVPMRRYGDRLRYGNEDNIRWDRRITEGFRAMSRVCESSPPKSSREERGGLGGEPLLDVCDGRIQSFGNKARMRS